jgi:hypothetical protein
MGASNWITSFPIFMWQTIYLFFIFPATVIIALFHFIAQLWAWTPFFFILFILWGGGSLTSRYGNVFISEVEYGFRCVINAVVENFIGPLLDLLRYASFDAICQCTNFP